jgi:hypothetical protein
MGAYCKWLMNFKTNRISSTNNRWIFLATRLKLFLLLFIVPCNLAATQERHRIIPGLIHLCSNCHDEKFCFRMHRLFVFFSPAHQAGRAHLSHVQFIAAAIVYKVRQSQHIYYFALVCSARGGFTDPLRWAKGSDFCISQACRSADRKIWRTTPLACVSGRPLFPRKTTTRLAKHTKDYIVLCFYIPLRLTGRWLL